MLLQCTTTDELELLPANRLGVRKSLNHLELFASVGNCH